MSKRDEEKVQKKMRPAISIDERAVALALTLALLVWLGAIKHIPW